MSSAPETEQQAESRRATSLGKYKLIARLGTGGMAEVFLAVAQGAMNVNRLVVVKLLRDERAEDEAAREMFLNEARLAARLAHANVVQTFEAGTERGSYFLAMEYVDGQPLSRVLATLKRQKRRIEPKLAARICADALLGLQHAHDLTDFDGTPLKIVHRDVSPQNIMLTYDGVVKIVDFGIAKAAGSSQTEHGVFKGKVAFMAPEQVAGDGVDRRADIFAAGIVLWEAVTGKPLMADENPVKTLHNLMNMRIPRASEVCPEIPRALDDVLERALERDVDRRFPTARAMRDALEVFIASEGGVRAEAVGELVSELFADVREKVQKQIKAQLAALSLHKGDGTGEHRLDRSRMRMRTGNTMLIDLSEGATVGDMSTSGAAVYRIVSGDGHRAEEAGSGTRRVALFAWMAVTMLAIGLSAGLLYRLQRAPLPAPAVAQPEPVAAVTAAARPEPVFVMTPSEPAPPQQPPPPAPKLTSAPAPVWRPTAAPALPPPPAQTSRAAAPASVVTPSPPPSQPAAKPAETATGRTFRRDL